ncbi:MAG: ChbG/HpnK family deacetylase [bacterium]
MRESLRRVSLVGDDAASLLYDREAARVINSLSTRLKEVITFDVEVTISSHERKSLVRRLDKFAPAGLHAVLDDAASGFYPSNRLGLFGKGGRLQALRLAYEHGKHLDANVFYFLKNRQVRDVIVDELRRQVCLFKDSFGYVPAHLSSHNGWWNFPSVMEAFAQVSGESRIPVRVRREDMHGILKQSPWETGAVVDNHNVKGREDLVRSPEKFARFVVTTLEERGVRAGEVVLHMRSNPEYRYRLQLELLSHRDFWTAMEAVGINLVTPHELLVHPVSAVNPVAEKAVLAA